MDIGTFITMSYIHFKPKTQSTPSTLELSLLGLMRGVEKKQEKNMRNELTGSGWIRGC